MKVNKKRRISGKTDYAARKSLLKSGKARIVIRKTNKYILIQYVKSFEAKDKIILGVSSYDLIKRGWPKEASGSLKSISAAYLTGYLAGKEIQAKEKKPEAIVDLGLYRNIHGSRLHAAVKGLIDSGVKLNANAKAFPTEERIKGENANKIIRQNFDKIKGSIQ